MKRAIEDIDVRFEIRSLVLAAPQDLVFLGELSEGRWIVLVVVGDRQREGSILYELGRFYFACMDDQGALCLTLVDPEAEKGSLWFALWELARAIVAHKFWPEWSENMRGLDIDPSKIETALRLC